MDVDARCLHLKEGLDAEVFKVVSIHAEVDVVSVVVDHVVDAGGLSAHDSTRAIRSFERDVVVLDGVVGRVAQASRTVRAIAILINNHQAAAISCCYSCLVVLHDRVTGVLKNDLCSPHGDAR